MTLDLLHPMLLPAVIPLLAGLVCLLSPPAQGSGPVDRLRTLLAQASTAAVLYFCWGLFRATHSEPLMAEPITGLQLRLDALGGFILLAIAAFAFLIAIFSDGYLRGDPRRRMYFTWYLWTLAAACTAVLANDLLLLLVCWGVLGLTLYLMAALAGPKAAGAARKSLMVVGGADALLLFGILAYAQLAGGTRMDGAALPLDSGLAWAALACCLAGSFAKAGVFPFHAWVPEFGAKADAPVSAYLPASLDKLLGIYLLVRIATALFELTPAVYGLLMALGGLTLIGAVLMALVQHDLKRLLSYHAVSQVGYMVLGIGTGTAVGLAGALFHLLNNVIYKSALFLGAGAVEKGTGTTDLDRLGGLSRLMPVTFIGCTISALAISGIPPLNGFASKWMIYQGLIESGGGGGAGWIVWLAVAMLGSALTLASFVKVLHAAFLCKPSPTVEAAAPNDGPLSMRIPILLLASACVVFGVFAFAIPLQWLILPVAPVAIDGVWWAGPATLLIVSSIVIGLVVYRLSYGASGPRRVPTWVGGERLDSSHVSGAPRSPERHLEVSGTDFYRTIEDLPSLRRYYAWTRARTFDLYEQLRRAAGLLIQPLRSVHTGILPAYLRWFLAGLLVVVWVVTQSGS